MKLIYSLTLSPEIIHTVDEMRKATGLSRSAQIEYILRSYIRQYHKSDISILPTH
jgi:metal-responsive CopG/Arc/MetJ family transcriptional regulator